MLRLPKWGFVTVIWQPRRLEVTTGNMAAPSKATVVLKAVKKITIQFCPFESNVRSTR